MPRYVGRRILGYVECIIPQDLTIRWGLSNEQSPPLVVGGQGVLVYLGILETVCLRIFTCLMSRLFSQVLGFEYFYLWWSLSVVLAQGWDNSLSPYVPFYKRVPVLGGASSWRIRRGKRFMAATWIPI